MRESAFPFKMRLLMCRAIVLSWKTWLLKTSKISYIRKGGSVRIVSNTARTMFVLERISLFARSSWYLRWVRRYLMAVVRMLGRLTWSSADCSFPSEMFRPRIFGSSVKSRFAYTALACAPSLNLVSSVSSRNAGAITLSLFDAAEVLRTIRRTTDGCRIVFTKSVPYSRSSLWLARTLSKSANAAVICERMGSKLVSAA